MADNPISSNYYKGFIAPDEQRLAKLTDEIENELKPQLEIKTKLTDYATGIFNRSRKLYESSFSQNKSIEDQIKDMKALIDYIKSEKKKEALANGMNEAQAEEYAIQSTSYLSGQLTSLIKQKIDSDALGKLKDNYESALTDKRIAQGNRTSADNNLFSALVSRQSVAADIHKNTIFYNFLNAAENRT